MRIRPSEKRSNDAFDRRSEKAIGPVRKCCAIGIVTVGGTGLVAAEAEVRHGVSRPCEPLESPGETDGDSLGRRRLVVPRRTGKSLGRRGSVLNKIGRAHV